MKYIAWVLAVLTFIIMATISTYRNAYSGTLADHFKNETMFDVAERRVAWHLYNAALSCGCEVMRVGENKWDNSKEKLTLTARYNMKVNGGVKKMVVVYKYLKIKKQSTIASWDINNPPKIFLDIK